MSQSSCAQQPSIVPCSAHAEHCHAQLLVQGMQIVLSKVMIRLQHSSSACIAQAGCPIAFVSQAIPCCRSAFAVVRLEVLVCSWHWSL